MKLGGILMIKVIVTGILMIIIIITVTYSPLLIILRSCFKQIRAAQGDYHGMVKMLLDDPRLAKHKDFISGYTALHWAAKHGKYFAFRLYVCLYWNRYPHIVRLWFSHLAAINQVWFALKINYFYIRYEKVMFVVQLLER